MNSVLEGIIGALVTALNTGRPAAVPVLERDRWIDVETGPDAGSAFVLAGWQDEPADGQNADRVTDQRRVRLSFEIYANASPTLTAAQVVDAAVQWLGSKCGPVDAGTGTLATAGAVRLTLEKKAAVVGKGGACRCLVELAADYRNLTNDLTRAR